MLQAALRLLGVNLAQKIAELGAQISELKNQAVAQVTGQVKEAGLTVGFIAAGALAAFMTFVVALAALFLWVDRAQGRFAGLAVVGLVTAFLAALMFALAFWRRKLRRAPAPVRVNPTPSPPAPASLSAASPPPPNASVLDVLAHRFSTRLGAAGEEAIDAAVDAMRTSSRSALFGTLAIVALVGVLIGRRRR